VTATYSWASYGVLEGASEEGRDIPFVRCSLGGGSDRKLRIWIQGGAHGNEVGRSSPVRTNLLLLPLGGQETTN
jgi:hypothetical protein